MITSTKKALIAIVLSAGILLAGCGKHDHSTHEHGALGDSQSLSAVTRS